MAPLKSWLRIEADSHFSLANIPFGIISTGKDSAKHTAVAIGDCALDLQVFAQSNGFAALSVIQPHQAVFSQDTLNAFAGLGRPMHKLVREYLQSVFLENGPFQDVLETNAKLQREALIPLANCTMHMPMQIGDYTDFYASLNHAYNVGVMFRGPQNALQPNYKHLPVGYHGRASSVVVSGTPLRRPNGQILADPTAVPKAPILSSSRKLDIELELGCFVCKPNRLGKPISIANASEHLFGLVLMNDWSARDIQAWDPWVVLMDALEPFAAQGQSNDSGVLPYLAEKNKQSHFDIDLSVTLTPAGSSTSTRITKTKGTNLLFSFPQMLVHHTVGGCPFNPGDLLGSGTISGELQSERGSLLEQTENGKVGVELEGGVTRMFLEDGDSVVISGVCGTQENGLVGFGTCEGTISPAVDLAG